MVAGAYAKPCVSDVKLVADSVEDTAYGNEVRREAAQVNEAGKYEPKLTENGIPADVLAKLLPGDDVVELSEPVIYAQRRVGKGGKIFNVYKFRSVYADAEARGAQWAQGDDPRVTPFDKIMRKTLMAMAIIGTPSDKELIESLSRSANSLLDLQLCGYRPESCHIVGNHCKQLRILSAAVFEMLEAFSTVCSFALHHLFLLCHSEASQGGFVLFPLILKAVMCNDGGKCCQGVA